MNNNIKSWAVIIVLFIMIFSVSIVAIIFNFMHVSDIVLTFIILSIIFLALILGFILIPDKKDMIEIEKKQYEKQEIRVEPIYLGRSASVLNYSLSNEYVKEIKLRMKEPNDPKYVARLKADETDLSARGGRSKGIPKFPIVNDYRGWGFNWYPPKKKCNTENDK